MSDFTVHNHGTIFLLQPNTPAAQRWIENHIPEDAQTFGQSVVVEHAYICGVVDGIRADNLVVR